MRVHLAGRGAVVALAAAAATVALAMPASAATVTDDHPGPHGYGVSADAGVLGINIPVGPLAETYLPGGPPDASIVNVPGSASALLTAGVIQSHVTLDATGNSSKASVADLALLPNQLTGTSVLSAGLIETSCTATSKGITTANNFANLKVAGQTLNGPRTTTKVLNITTPGLVGQPGIPIAKVTINEKITQADGDVVVNGLHIVALPGQNILSGDVVLAHSHCAPAALPVPMASGVGLYAGLGLLGVIAIPVVGFGIRRRRAGAAVTA